MSAEGCSDAQTAGRCGWPKILHRPWASSCTQATPAGLPAGMPGMGELMEGAVQQAAQAGRQVGTAVAEGQAEVQFSEVDAK